MKSKCSFILKASTALVLALLMLFGTVTTSVAAVVDNAKSSAAADTDAEPVAHGAEGFFAMLRKHADLAETGADPTGFTSGTYVYLVPGTDWYGNSKKAAAYFYNSNSDNAWSSVITLSTSASTKNRITVPGSNKTWAHVIFVSLNSSATAANWDNKWNQTGDLDYDSSKNCFTNSGWDGATTTWSKYVPTSSATLSASPTDITTSDTSTLTPGISGNTTYNEYKSVSYSISPSSGASISGNTFTPTSAGEYTVTATVTYNAKGFPGATETATNTATITVTEPTTPMITSISSSSSSLKIGETATITTVLANTSSPTVTYSSSDSTVLSVTKVSNTEATIKALKPGSATITASLSDSGTTDSKTTSSISVATPTIATYSYTTSSMLIGTSSSTPSKSLTSDTYNSSSTITWNYYLASTGTTSSNNYVTINTSTGVMTAKSTVSALTPSNQNVYAVATVTYNGVSYTTARKSATYSVFAYFLMGLGGGWSETATTLFTYDSSRSVWSNSRALTAKTYQGDTDGFKVVKSVNGTKTYYDYTSVITMTRSSNDNKTTALDSSSTGNFKITADVAGTYVFDLALTNNTTPSTIKPHYPQKVNYDKSGKTTTAFPTTPAYVTYNTAIGSAPSTTPAADGYTFDTWVTTSGGSTAFDFANTKITSETTIYAKWTGQTKTLTVQALAKESSSGNYDQAATSITNSLKIGGTTRTSADVEVETEITVEAPATDPDGYVFVGWYDGSTQKSTSRSYTYTMATTAKLLTARYDRMYTLTISKATNNGTVNATSKEVYYNDAPGSFTVTPSSGYRIKYANCTNLSTYYTVPSGTTGTQTMTGKAAANITDANKINKTITIAFEEITPVVTFTSYKTDNGSTYSVGGGALTATYSTGGGGSTPTPDPEAPARYLWKNASNQNQNSPANYSVKCDFTAATDGNYYTSFPVTAGTNFYFLINDSSSSATSGNRYIYSTTSIDKGSGIANWAKKNTYNISGTDYIFCEGYCATTVYVKYSPSEDKVYLQNSAFTYTAAGSGGGEGGGEGEGESTSGSVVSGGTVPYNANVTFTAPRVASVGGNMYQFVGWYSSAQPASNETALSTELTYTKSNVNDDVSVYARYKKVLYLTFYNSYMRENESSPWQFVAAPPRTVTVGMGSNVRATYTYKAGNAEQRGEEHTVNATGDYYEGNTLLVLVGETVTLKFTTLASSDAIRGIFFNNARRYTTETETDNLYYLRDPKEGGGAWTSTDLPEGAVADDDWEYDYLANTTIYADENYYDGATATTIHNNYDSYVGKNAMNQSTHEISWEATQDYLNIDVELDNKYQLHINDDDWEGLKIENMNDEGYYFGGETFANNFKLSIDNTDVTDGEYFFTGTTATVTDKDGNAVSGVTVSPKQSGGSAATSTSNLSYFLVSGTMPRTNVYITIPMVKKYKLRLANIVVSDSGTNKRTMLTETSGSATSSTGHIGTITAIPKTGNTTGSDISSDGTYYTYPSNNNSGEVSVYASSTNNKYLKGGVNKNGSLVEAGSTVTYTFTFASGKDAEYTFVGWFEGDKNGDTFTPNYNKKLSGKQSFTYTPTKDTIVFAVGTRDIYLGGNFTSDGAYTTTSASKTWSSGRILMDFDPTYTNPNDSTKKGRYVYKFETVTPNTEYQFRCYDTASGTDTTNLSVWSTWSGSDYGQNNDDILFGRHKYDAQYGYSHGAFVYKTNTNNWDLIDNTGDNHSSTKNHQANGYAAPVEVYFYAYDGGITINSTYQWSRAYVSAGVGIDVKSVSGGTTTYNIPTVSVANKTVNNKDVTVTDETYGNEAIKNCLVKENNGQIVVTASPADANVELQAFLVYNIDTKKSEAVKTFTTSGSGASKSYIGNITIPNNSKIYVVPIYKFTDTYITNQHLETHEVFVRADDIDKDDWGGLVSMYSWGTTSGYDSGGWPGQLMVPSDDGNSFTAPLTFQAGGLAGVTFNNYTKVWGGNYVNFLGLYQSSGVSDTVYSGYTNTGTHYIYQVFDYREPISIIENINTPEPKIYDSEDMTLTFELKPGNKTAATIGNGAYNASFDYEYLTDSSGKYRVDLNGNKLSTNSTASYYVVCNYTEAYAPSGGTKTYGFAPATKNRYSIDWNVYDINGQLVTNGTQLSASFTDVEKSEMLTYIAKQLIDDGQPVSGRAVKIAYENPKVSSSDNTEAVRYSGQWYADGINTIIEGNVRVGIYSDGAWLPSDTNAPGYATATVEFAPDASKGEAYVTEDGCSGNSLAKVTKIHAANGDVTFRVSTTDNFLGWYREDGKGGYEPIGSNYKNQSVSLSFNEDITYYAFYSASASYRFKYTGRDGTTKYFTAKGTDLTDAELENSGTLNPTLRALDIASKLAKVSDITVFNHTLTYALTNADTSAPYTITYTAGDTEDTYTLTVKAYNSSGSLVTIGNVEGTWSTPLDVTNDSRLGKGESLVTNKPSGQSNKVFIGWKKEGTADSAILSTQANFGYSITQDTTIVPVFGDARITAETWSAGIDKNFVTQELTNASTGTIYNDTLVNFRYAKATGEQFDLDSNECGVLIFAQSAEDTETAGSTFISAMTQAKAEAYARNFIDNNRTAGKLSATYGNAVALRIKANSLSRLNRIDLYQVLDYATYSGGNYKVIAYAKVGNSYVYSDVVSGTYVPTAKD